jgi:hypothetical protein
VATGCKHCRAEVDLHGVKQPPNGLLDAIMVGADLRPKLVKLGLPSPFLLSLSSVTIGLALG